MSGFLFLAGVCGFVLIVLWAYKNDGLKADELGSGILAMRLAGGEKQKTVPKWKKSGMPERFQAKAGPKKTTRASRWQQSLHYGKGR
ncbi:MAG TPA: hypothetical protein VGI89_00265 [Rhizomicrobium sp.]|jgi:hypothetical protein